MISRKTGTLKYFNPSANHGKISTLVVDQEVYIHIQDVEEEAINLLKGEEVEFDLVAGHEPGSFTAKNLKRLRKRYTGSVLTFEDGKGLVKCFQNNEECTLYFKDFVDSSGDSIHKTKRIKIESGDEVEFDIEDDERFGLKATKVFYDGRKPLERFSKLPNWDRRLAELAKMSPEPWDYLNSDPDNRFLPVLSNYIYYTFARLRKEERIHKEKRIAIEETTLVRRDVPSKKQVKRTVKCACFNTGLATKYQEEIFAYFLQNEKAITKNDPEWYLVKFCKSSDSEMNVFGEKPEWANYFKELQDYSEIFYDTALHHDLMYEHILKDRHDRFPAELLALSESTLQALLDQGLANAKKRVRRNYKAAVPQYYNGKLQLLLPLTFSKDKTELALAVERVGKRYISRTVLKLEWAYSNARLIAKPDREWLDPVKESNLEAAPKNSSAESEVPA